MKVFITLIVFFMVQIASAESFPELTSFLEKEITTINAAVAQIEPAATLNEDVWNLKRTTLRLKADFGIKVPWVSSLLISPEVELVWLKKQP